MEFERLELEKVDWKHLDSFDDRSVYQTEPWLRFLQKTQNCEPVVASVKNGGATLGYFTGCVFRRFGLRMLGSPFPGWTTSYMGFNLQPGAPRLDAVRGLAEFAFDTLGCVHFELMDRQLGVEDTDRLPCHTSRFVGYEIDLTLSEDELFRNMDSDYRRCTRNAERNGVYVEECSDPAFVDEYYVQLRDVFAKQRLVPTYSLERVRAMYSYLQPSGMLLALRARDNEGKCIATGIFLGVGNTAYFWGGASWRQYQILRPNHAIQWYAMRYWKRNGFSRYDMGGGGRYKANFGGRSILVPWLRMSKYPIFEKPRQLYKSFRRKAQQALGAGLSRH
jgi:hypothetical protein